MPNLLFLAVTIVVIIIITMVFAGKLSASCDRQYMTSFYAFFGLEVVFYVLTVVFGVSIIRRLGSERRRSTVISESLASTDVAR